MTPSSPSSVPMKNNPGNGGFTYLMTLMLVVIMGIMLGMVGQSWKTVMKREREEELIYRGLQIRDAIKDWNDKENKKNPPPTKLTELKHLVQDPRVASVKRRLRREYTDPITGKEWNLIMDPVLGIVGVASTSTEKPLKTGGFPDDLKELTEKQKYSDWKFIYQQNRPGTQPSSPAPRGSNGP